MDNFREWLSDNLRYFMLGGGILIVVAVLFFGIRACVGNKKGNSEQEQITAENNNQGNDPSSPNNAGETNDEKKETTNPMEAANEDIAALMKQYYKALGEKDIATLKTLVDDLTPSDETRVTNAKDYIEGYQVGDIYTKQGMKEDTYVVYVKFDYICKGIDTPAPALSWSYVKKDSEGSWKIDGGAIQDAEISAYVSKLESDDDVKKLYSDVKAANEKALEESPALAEFLEGLGEDASASVSSENGTILTVTDGCNVRASADAEEDNIIGGLDAGTQVEKLGTDGEWIQIEYEGQTGYVHSSLLEEQGQEETTEETEE